MRTNPTTDVLPPLCGTVVSQQTQGLWAEVCQLRREVARLTAERDELRREIDAITRMDGKE